MISLEHLVVEKISAFLKKRDGGMSKGHRSQHAVALWNGMSSNIKNKILDYNLKKKY